METVGKIFVIVLISVGLSLLMAFPTMWLWNWLMPNLFNLPIIGFVEALGINIFASILFKSNNASSK